MTANEKPPSPAPSPAPPPAPGPGRLSGLASGWIPVADACALCCAAAGEYAALPALGPAARETPVHAAWRRRWSIVWSRRWRWRLLDELSSRGLRYPPAWLDGLAPDDGARCAETIAALPGVRPTGMSQIAWTIELRRRQDPRRYELAPGPGPAPQP